MKKRKGREGGEEAEVKPARSSIAASKRKRIVDRSAIKPDRDTGGGVPFKDQTTDLYLAMDLISDMGQGDPFRDYTPTLRVEEYQKAIDIQCRLLERQTGFSPGTFSFDIKTGRMTATQVVSDDKEGLRQKAMSGMSDLVKTVSRTRGSPNTASSKQPLEARGKRAL